LKRHIEPLSSIKHLTMSRQTIRSAVFFVTAITFVAVALALPSFFPARAFAPDFPASQDRASQTPSAETGAMHSAESCAPLEVDSAENSPRSNSSAGTTAKSNHVIPARQNFSGLQNFAQITPTLYRGGRPTVEGLACLAKMGVSIVISEEGKYKDLRKPVERLGMQYVSMFWECSFPKDKIFANFLQLLRDNPGKKVFVYCHYGDDRTSMMIAAYRIAEQGWSAEEAKEEMKDFGFNFYHRRICTGLSDYEDHFPRHWREGHAFDNLRATPSMQP
jgi:tyrosine-protein phosphatase SIW14